MNKRTLWLLFFCLSLGAGLSARSGETIMLNVNIELGPGKHELEGPGGTMTDDTFAFTLGGDMVFKISENAGLGFGLDISNPDLSDYYGSSFMFTPVCWASAASIWPICWAKASSSCCRN